MRAFEKLKSFVGSAPNDDSQPRMLEESADSNLTDPQDTLVLNADSRLLEPVDTAPLTRPGQPNPKAEATPYQTIQVAKPDKTPVFLLDELDDTQPVTDAPSQLAKPDADNLAADENADDDIPLSTIIPASKPIVPRDPISEAQAKAAAASQAVNEKKIPIKTTRKIEAPMAPKPKKTVTATQAPLLTPMPPAPVSTPKKPDTPLPMSTPPMTTQNRSTSESKPETARAVYTPGARANSKSASRPEPSQARPSLDARALGPVKKTDSLAHMRNDLAQLNKDMSSGEQFYAQSLRRISDLIDYAYQTEATLSALEKLEPENQRLKDQLAIVHKDLTDQVVRAETLKSKSDTYEARYMETRQALEKSQLSLTQLENLREMLEREVAGKDNDIAVLINKAREVNNAHNLDKQTIEQLASKNAELSNDLSLAMSERLETEKRLQEVITRFESVSQERDNLDRMVTQTRNAHRAVEEHNLSLKTQLESVLADVKIFKQQFDAATQNKDAEIDLLRGRLADHQSEIAVKEGVVSHVHSEMADMREKFEAAHRGRRKLLEHIESQKMEADHLRDRIAQMKDQHNQLTGDFVDSQTEIETLKRVNSIQSEKLTRYMALNAAPVSQEPAFSIRPDVFRPAAQTPPSPAPAQRPVFDDAPVATPSLSRDYTDSFEVADLPAPAAEPSFAKETHDSLNDLAASHPDTNAHPDINHDFEPETQRAVERRAPDSPLRARSNPESYGLDSEPEQDVFQREMASLAAMAPIQNDYSETPPPMPKETLPSPTKPQAQKIEDDLLRFHDLDLLSESLG